MLEKEKAFSFFAIFYFISFVCVLSSSKFLFFKNSSLLS